MTAKAPVGNFSCRRSRASTSPEATKASADSLDSRIVTDDQERMDLLRGAAEQRKDRLRFGLVKPFLKVHGWRFG